MATPPGERRRDEKHMNTYCILKGEVVFSVVGTELSLQLWFE